MAKGWVFVGNLPNGKVVLEKGFKHKRQRARRVPPLIRFFHNSCEVRTEPDHLTLYAKGLTSE